MQAAPTIHLALLLLLVAFCQWRPVVSALVRRPAYRKCEYEGQVFHPGSRFSPDRCTRCHCPRRGGPPHCTVQDCLQDAHCLQYDNKTRKCCPECLEYGCRHSNGNIFLPGEVIRDEPCVRCYCPVGGGNPVCDVTSCPLSQCVDPVKVDGVCCPVCPRGPNCQIGLLTLPIGQSVVVEGAVCTCETFTSIDGEKRTMARCNKN